MDEDVSDAMSFCFKNKIKCYPVSCGFGWKIQVDNNGKINTYSKILNDNNEKNDAVVKTYIHFYNKLK